MTACSSTTTSSSSAATPSYLILRAPVRPDDLEFPSLAAELPAVNWQEREIQDWFGLKAVGHPESPPRRAARQLARCASAAQGFPFRRVLAPVRRRAARLPAHAGRGRLPDSGGPGSRRHHRAGPFQLRGRRRADPLPAIAHVLHAQGNREALRESADSPRCVSGREHFRRFRFLPRHGVLPGDRARGRDRSPAIAP